MQADPVSLTQRPAELVLVAGPNGSGKSSIADLYIQARFPLWPKLNADRVLLKLEQTQTLAASPMPMLQAAQLVDETARCLALLREPFVLETVLSSHKYQRLVSIARQVGLIFRLVYVTTIHPTINVVRVRQRVLDGGHDVPEDRIIQRWHRSMSNLTWFAARADRLVVADNSGSGPVAIALRHLGGPLELRDRQHPASKHLIPLSDRPTLGA